MILEPLKVLDIRRVGEVDEGMQAGIAEDSYPYVFEIMSTNFYSNAIGSVVREITSNCFDSHIEAEVDDPVIISKTYDLEEGYAIEFKDVGVGLSPDRINTVYRNYFSSTKRLDNKQIGAFGLGSKTPLAYTDMFYITTIYEGIRYEYIFHKGENRPTIELLNQEETDEHNGTTIKIVMERNDVEKFKKELQFQLAYFDSVYFKNWGISNEYDIYEGEYFKFRSDMEQYNTEVHLCIGKVRYTIDFTKVAIPISLRKMPVAVKFEIGELKITPSRESLRYDEEGMKLIKERVLLAGQEIMAMFEAQNPEVESLDEYIYSSRSTPAITFNKDKGHELYIWASSGINKTYRFKPLADLAIKKVPNNMFFMWEKIGYIKSGVFIPLKGYNRSDVDNDTVAAGNIIIFTKEDRLSIYTNLYIAEHLNESYLTVIQRKEIDFDNVSNLLAIKESKTIGKAKTISQYIKIVGKIVHEKGHKYADLRPSDEWVNEYKKSVRESSAAWQRKKNKKVFVRDAAIGFRGREISHYDLEKRKGILVYGHKEDKNILDCIYEAVVVNKESIKKLKNKTVRTGKKRGQDRQPMAFMVLQVSQEAEKYVVDAKKAIYWEDFLKTKFFRKIETGRHIYYELLDLAIPRMEIRKQLTRGFREDYGAVKESHREYFTSTSSFRISDNYLNKNYIFSMLLPLEKFKAKHIPVCNIPLAGFLSVHKIEQNDVDSEEYIKYLKYKKVSLANWYYLKSLRQLEYEKGVKKILEFIKNPIINNNLLTFTINQTENDQEISIIDQDRGNSFF